MNPTQEQPVQEQPAQTQPTGAQVPPTYAQPVYAPEPQQNYQPYAQQPVQQVHYVVNQKSLEGLGGWLMFFLVVFALNGVGYISLFFEQLAGINNVTLLIFAPFIAISAIASVALISMRKRIARWSSMVTVALSTLYATVSTFTMPAEGDMLSARIASALITLVFGGLICLYFYSSKRVNQTLVK